MAEDARFGPPVAGFTPGGAHIAVHLVPVYAGQIVAFDIGRPVPGRWLPWDLLPFGGNPYETAAALGDGWCDGAVVDLRICDALSLPEPGASWELALIFRAELASLPAGDDRRSPVHLGPAELGSVRRFAAQELARWLGTAPAGPPRDDAPRLVF